MDIGKIVLIMPRRDGSLLGKAPGTPYTLMRLASLVPADVPVEIWDENRGTLPLHTLTPHDLVGITSMTLTIDQAREITAAARPYLKDSGRVVVGGTHATLAPEDVAAWADSVVIGEAYRTWPQLIQDFADGRLKQEYRDEEWSSLVGVAPLTDRVIHQVNEHRNYWTPYLEITRGCPRNCHFCTAIRVSGRVMRHRPIGEVVEEIERRRLRRFFLTDDNFGLNFRLDPEYIEQLFRALEPLPLQGWNAQAELMVGDFPDLLKLAHCAHMDKLFIGFESINPNNKHELGGKSKGDVTRNKQVIRRCHEAGIGVVGLFVFGFDADTPEVFQATWDFIRESELDGASLTVMTPYPGTQTRRELIEQGRLLPAPWRDYDTAHVTYTPKLMTVQELQRTYDWMCKTVYNPVRIAARGYRAWRRYSVQEAPSKLFSSFSTDVGYRRAYSFRNS